MNLWPAVFKSAVIFAVVIFLISVLPAQASSAESANTGPCSAPEYRAFDFWVGDWDAYEVNDPHTKVAHNRVDRILGSCVLLEDYQGTNGSHGQSFSIYDATRKVWHQSWVTNHGALLIIEGKIQNDEMVLSGIDRNEKGEERHVRGTWKPVDGGVREVAVTSTDGGKTWKPWFDLMFRPAAVSKSGNASTDDKSILAALDTQYQAAVKSNDASVIDRIVADDFVFTTGSGRTFDKAELLDDARGGQVSYTHNEDSNRTVRVWGDMAVVTAKLWEQGVDHGKPFDNVIWFSDIYVRTPSGWRYQTGQSSLAPPKASIAAAN
jgi:hypothetical protein